MTTTIKQEQRILAALIDNLGAAGFMPAAVWLGDAYVMVAKGGADLEETRGSDMVRRPMTKAEVMQVFEDYSLANPTVHFTHQHATTWGNLGVMVVPGNGCDFISDWHCQNAAFNAIVEQVADAASNEVYS